jgi:hypothetical protein
VTLDAVVLEEYAMLLIESGLRCVGGESGRGE